MLEKATVVEGQDRIHLDKATLMFKNKRELLDDSDKRANKKPKATHNTPRTTAPGPGKGNTTDKAAVAGTTATSTARHSSNPATIDGAKNGAN